MYLEGTGETQDNGTTSGSYEDLTGWNRDRGGDGFTPVYHPIFPNLRIATVQYGNFAYSQDPQDETDLNWVNMEDTDYDDRNGWDSPIMMHPANPNHIWTGTQRMWKMEGGPMGYWESMSEDLTYNIEPALSYRVISSIAGSPFDENALAAGPLMVEFGLPKTEEILGKKCLRDCDRYVTDIYLTVR